MNATTHYFPSPLAPILWMLRFLVYPTAADYVAQRLSSKQKTKKRPN